MTRPASRRSRAGVTAVEVFVAVALLLVAALVLMTLLPRQREAARARSCQRSLHQIGIALALYDQAQRHLPAVPELGRNDGETRPRRPDGPLAALLETLGQTDFSRMSDPAERPASTTQGAPAERLLPGLLCPADRLTATTRFPAPVSYRATTGSRTDGADGAFAPGQTRSLAEIEAADGLSYTAAFSERLLGTGADGQASPRNYQVTSGPTPGMLPEIDAATAPWKGDAGSSWARAGWAESLYNHDVPPDFPRTWIAGDVRSSNMGASSAHPGGVHLLRFDLSVETIARTIDPGVWRRLATLREPTPQGSPATASTQPE